MVIGEQVSSLCLSVLELHTFWWGVVCHGLSPKGSLPTESGAGASPWSPEAEEELQQVKRERRARRERRGGEEGKEGWQWGKAGRGAG